MGVADQAYFNSNNPRDFGWTPASNIVAYTFTYNTVKYTFPGGVHNGTQKLWDDLFKVVVPRIVGGIHPGGYNVAGTWGYQNRNNVNAAGSLSFHAFGLACDVNAPWNGNGGSWGNGPYQIGSWAGKIARDRGFLSGGEFKDPMHFELHLSPSQVALRVKELGGTPTAPPKPGTPAKPGPATKPTAFPLPKGYYFGPLSGPKQSISGMYASDTAAQRAAIQRIQRKLGIPDDGRYGPQTQAKVKSWQAANKVPADGLVGPVTWKAMGL